MYNEEIKREFVEYYKNVSSENTNIEVLKGTFVKTEKYEELYRKDVSQFTLDEIKSAIFGFNSSSVASVSTRISLLRGYANWCIKKGWSIDYINHYNEVDLNLISLITPMSNKFIDELDVWDLISRVDGASEKLLILAHYEGLIKKKNGEELLYLKPEDVDFEGKVVHLPARNYKASDDMLRLIRGAIEQTERVSGIGVTKVLDEGYVYKTLKPRDSIVMEKYTSRVLRALKQNLDDERLTVSNLMNSGFLTEFVELQRRMKLPFVKLIRTYEYKELCANRGVFYSDANLRTKYKGYLKMGVDDIYNDMIENEE